VLRDVPSRDQDLIKAGAADYAKADHDRYRTESRLTAIRVFTTTDCDTLYFAKLAGVAGARADDPCHSGQPDSFKTVILLTAFSALRYRP
jgi:hypothetical protein